MVAIQHLEAIDFPSPPIIKLAPKTNRNVSRAKIEVGEIRQSLAVEVSLFQDDGAAPEFSFPN